MTRQWWRKSAQCSRLCLETTMKATRWVFIVLLVFNFFFFVFKPSFLFFFFLNEESRQQWSYGHKIHFKRPWTNWRRDELYKEGKSHLKLHCSSSAASVGPAAPPVSPFCVLTVIYHLTNSRIVDLIEFWLLKCDFYLLQTLFFVFPNSIWRLSTWQQKQGCSTQMISSLKTETNNFK